MAKPNDGTKQEMNRVIRYPEFDITFFTEDSSYNVKYDTYKRPSNDLASNSVISLTTKNALEDDSAVFSIVLSGDMYWDRLLGTNDAVVLRINPNIKGSKPENDVILVGLISEVRLEADYGNNSKMYRITGQSFAKAFMDFNIGVIQEVSVVLTSVGWLPDDESSGVKFTGQNASAIAKSIIERFIKYMAYKFEKGKKLSDFLDIKSLDSWTKYESLVDPTPFINYEGSIKQLLDDVTEKPFNENFFDFTSDGKCKMMMRRTPFDKEEWTKLPASIISSKAVLSESVAKSDVEVYSIFSLSTGMTSLFDSVTMGVMPRYFPNLVDKYGYTKLELENRYLMTAQSGASSGSGGNGGGSTDKGDGSKKPPGKELQVQATAYSMHEAGLDHQTATGIDLRVNPRVIAVDPSFIPLGSQVWVEGMGNYIAGDTGGDIKGSRIDIHMNSVEECNRFGRQNKLLVLKSSGKSSGARSYSLMSDGPSSSLESLVNQVNKYLSKYNRNNLRVKKSVISKDLSNLDSRLSRGDCMTLIDIYTKKGVITTSEFSKVTRITEDNIHNIGDQGLSYYAVNRFVRDYADMEMKDKPILVNALNSEFEDLTIDESTSIATQFLEEKTLTNRDFTRAVDKDKKDDKKNEPSSQDGAKLKLFTEKMANWYCENMNFYSGEIKVVGSPDYRVGTRLFYNDMQNNETWEYYIEGVQHDYSYTEGFVTTLSVTRGLQNGGNARFTNLWGTSQEFKGGLLGEKSLEELYEEGKKDTEFNGGGTNGGSNGGGPSKPSGGVSAHTGAIGSMGVYKYLSDIAQITIDKFGNLSMTSGYREGDPYYHGRRQAIDIAHPPSMNGSPKNKEVANWVFENFPDEVAYVITNRQVRDRSGFSGHGKSGQWVHWSDNDHDDHIHINGKLGAKDIRN